MKLELMQLAAKEAAILTLRHKYKMKKEDVLDKATSHPAFRAEFNSLHNKHSKILLNLNT